MAVDAFLKLDGIKGESLDNKHKDEIELDSYSFGLSQAGSGSFGGGGGAGKVQFQDFHFTTNTSKASPLLMLACATGKHINEGVISLRKAGDKPLEFIHIKLQDCLVSSYQMGGSGGNLPIDQFSLNFGKIEFEYQVQKADGSLEAAIHGGWDLKQNKAG